MAKVEFSRSLGVLDALFDKSIYPFSPVLKDVERKVSYDENGTEVVSYVPVDYKKLQQERGSVEMWSLDAMLKSGINPDIPIHTGNNTRFEGINDVNSASAEVENIFNANDNQ